MLRILYLMHIDWDWIWQRPQALAAALAERHDVRVLYRANPFRSRLTANTSTVRRSPLLPIPERFLGRLAHGLQRLYLGMRAMGKKPDILWLTHPDLWPLVPSSIRQHAYIVYDCMDLATGFTQDIRSFNIVRRQEQELLDRADLVICSSRSLLKTLTRQGEHARLHVVENGLDESWIASAPALREKANGNLALCYFGTISHWLDWSLLQECLEGMPNLTLSLIGPQECVPPFVHERMTILPPVAHDRLPEAIAGCDAFILPFQINELTRHVNPVKLYEYLALGRPVLAVRNAETERFGNYVRLFSNRDEALDALRQVADGSLRPTNADALLKASTWSARAQALNDILADGMRRR